ncbi:hypothetical protein BU25DRAFT_241549 [Macroventuria anomochaeta]|uniref:Uncharacterized protein n=1 Tax=Macroventuria anomochaeta TaxID=301207 RepID=A0ACB6RIG0_9PLEO|nr:uncharacterized protein BU25DRAFT_241549 [Macroventuria anomochaeta]KAF2621190.1 hypothetical protein BU25DRAFT_241549 [Macroventuria anomochaeta]
MRKIALDVWGQNLFRLRFRPVAGHIQGEPRQVNLAMTRPSPGRHCRGSHVRFDVPRMLSWRKHILVDKGSYPRWDDCQERVNVWRRLLTSQNPLVDSHDTAWQQELPNPRDLCVILKTERTPLLWHQSIERFLNAGLCHLRADRVTVRTDGWQGDSYCVTATDFDNSGREVRGFAMVRHCPHRCAAGPAIGLRALMERPRRVAEKE